MMLIVGDLVKVNREDAIESINDYKNTYFVLYGKKPSEKLMESFCKINGIPWPLPRNEEEIEFNIPTGVEILFGGESEG